MTLSSNAAMVKLRPYVGEHGVVPPLSTLAKLWGYASKASAARVVTTLVKEFVLVRAPDGRLRPGPRFLTDISRSAERHDQIAKEWKHRWTAEGLAEAYDISTRITRLAQAIDDSARRTAARNGLTVGELLVLDVLYRMGPPFLCAPTTLTHHFALSLPGVAKRIRSLQRKGLIDRVPSDTDRRSLLVQLNPQGREKLEKAAETDMRAPHIQWVLGMGSSARTSLIATLRHALAEIEMPRPPRRKNGRESVADFE
jgi:DNA-binding MarR family transcriptional regulator